MGNPIPDEDLGEYYENLVATHGKDVADAILKIGMGTTTRRKRQVPRRVGVPDKAMAAIPLTRGNPNWREQKARSFRCRHCGGSGEAITITGAESPDQPTMANCSCGESWQLTSRRKH